MLNSLPALSKDSNVGEEDAKNFIIKLILSYKEEDISELRNFISTKRTYFFRFLWTILKNVVSIEFIKSFKECKINWDHWAIKIAYFLNLNNQKEFTDEELEEGKDEIKEKEEWKV